MIVTDIFPIKLLNEYLNIKCIQIGYSSIAIFQSIKDVHVYYTVYLGTIVAYRHQFMVHYTVILYYFIFSIIINYNASKSVWSFELNNHLDILR